MFCGCSRLRFGVRVIYGTAVNFSGFIFTVALVVYITAMITHVLEKQANKQATNKQKTKLKATFVMLISDVLILSPHLMFFQILRRHRFAQMVSFYLNSSLLYFFLKHDG